MLHLYLDNSDYVLCNPTTFQVGNWKTDVAKAITSYFRCTTPYRKHSVFGNNRYTLTATYPYDTLADFQANHPELFI